MEFVVTGDIGQEGFPSVVSLLNYDSDTYVCVIVNFKSETTKWVKALELQLANIFLSVDVIQNNRKTEKNIFLRLFVYSQRQS